MTYRAHLADPDFYNFVLLVKAKGQTRRVYIVITPITL